MIIGFATIKVREMEESEAFYQKYLDLEKVRNFSPQEGTEIVFMEDEEGNLLELIDDNSLEESFFKNNSPVVSIGVQVDDLAQIQQKIEQNNINITKGPIEVPSGEKMFFITDPNGVEIEFIEGF